MEKRGRPPKPKIKTAVKRRVGRPCTKKDEATQFRTRRIWGVWILLNHLKKHLPHSNKIKAIAETLLTSQATVKNAVTELNKNLDSGKWAALYAWEYKLVIIFMHDEKSYLIMPLYCD